MHELRANFVHDNWFKTFEPSVAGRTTLQTPCCSPGVYSNLESGGTCASKYAQRNRVGQRARLQRAG